jgi:hypothetical protein
MLVIDPAGNPVYGVRVTEAGDILPHEDVPAR